MITSKELERLTGLESDEGIVSLYLRMEPRLRYEQGLAATQFKSAYKQFERRDSRDEWIAAAEREYPRILEFLGEEDNVAGRGLALFACRPADIWESVRLEVPVPTSFNVDSTPRIGLLTRVLDDFPRLLVAIVQRDKATIYLSEQGEVDEGESIVTTVPGSHDTGGFSQARFQRHIEFHVREHLKEVVERLEAIDRETPFKRIVLGGTHEVTAELQSLLPESLREKVVGTFAADVKHGPEDALLEKAHSVATEAERQEEIDLVTQIANEEASGGRGVLGPDDTLRALVEGRTQKLALLEDIECAGLECPSCDYIAASGADRCPACGERVERSSNVLDRAIERAYLSGVEVEFVSGEARDQLLPKGGIGALLRY